MCMALNIARLGHSYLLLCSWVVIDNVSEQVLDRKQWQPEEETHHCDEPNIEQTKP